MRSVAQVGALLGVVAATAACAGACEMLTGSRYQVERSLVAIADAPLTGPGTELGVRFVSDTIRVDGEEAVAFSRGEVEGRYRGVKTSCICIEAVRFVRTPAGWRYEGFPLQRLEGVVAALEGRQSAFEARDAQAYLGWVHPDYDDDGTDHAALAGRLERLFEGTGAPEQEVVSRVLRVEREEAVVTETFRLRAELDGEVVEHEGRARYVLRPTADGWRFVSGLM